MSELLNAEAEKLKELEGLISLAEESTKIIDGITAELRSIRALNVNQSFVIMIAITLTAVVILLLADYQSNITKPLQLIAATFNFILIAKTMVLYGSRKYHAGKLKEKLLIEYKVQQRLISLIDDQIKRVQFDVSPVAFAILEVRTKRLMRSKEFA